MGKIKYDVSSSDPDKAKGGQRQSPRPGLYVAEIIEINETGARDQRSGKPDPDRPMLEVIFQITDADKEKNKKYEGSRMWHYPLLPGHPSFDQTAWKLDQFLQAIGVATKKKRKGSFDPDDFIGTEVALMVRAGKDQDKNYRGEIAAVMEYDEDTFGEDSDDDDDDEMDDDDIEDREDDDEDEDEDDDEDGDDDDESDEDEEESYEDWSVADLRAECVERGLSKTGKKSDLVARLEENDEEEEEEEEEPEPPKKKSKSKTSSKSAKKSGAKKGKKSDDDDDEFPFED